LHKFIEKNSVSHYDALGLNSAFSLRIQEMTSRPGLSTKIILFVIYVLVLNTIHISILCKPGGVPASEAEDRGFETLQCIKL
jgi:hypothetical protein